jgi:hypothetical protein
MTVKLRLKTALVAGLFFISAGGLFLHLFIHEPQKHAYGFVPLAVATVGSLVIPWLFCFRKTIHLAYLLNGFAVIIGTVTMGHFSLVKGPIYPDIAILWAKFAMGYVIFHLEMYKIDSSFKPGWRTIRYPNFGFWVVHLVVFSVVYALGNILWR